MFKILAHLKQVMNAGHKFHYNFKVTNTLCKKCHYRVEILAINCSK